MALLCRRGSHPDATSYTDVESMATCHSCPATVYRMRRRLPVVAEYSSEVSWGLYRDGAWSVPGPDARSTRPTPA